MDDSIYCLLSRLKKADSKKNGVASKHLIKKTKVIVIKAKELFSPL